MTGRQGLSLAGAVVLGLIVMLLVLMRQSPTTQPPIRHDASRSTVVAIAEPPSHIDVPVDAAGPSVRDERETLVANLRDSGPGTEPWDGQGLTLLDSLSHEGVEVRDAACFVAGCAATFTFSSESEYAKRIASLQLSDGYRAWTGGHRLTTPERRADGHVVVALLLYRPD